MEQSIEVDSEEQQCPPNITVFLQDVPLALTSFSLTSDTPKYVVSLNGKLNDNFWRKTIVIHISSRWSSGTSVPHFTSIASCGQVPNIDNWNRSKKKHSIVSIYTVQLSVEQNTLSLYHFVDFVLLTGMYVFCLGFRFCYSNKDKVGKWLILFFIVIMLHLKVRHN